MFTIHFFKSEMVIRFKYCHFFSFFPIGHGLKELTINALYGCKTKVKKKKERRKTAMCSCFYLWANIGLPDVELTFLYTKTIYIYIYFFFFVQIYIYIYIPWYSVLKFELMTFDKAIMNVLL